MNRITIATAAAAGLAAAVLGLAAPAAGAPSGAGAQETISQLQEQGNRVVVHRLSDSPLSEAEVVTIRAGEEIKQWVWDSDRDDRHLQVTGRVYYVDVR